LPTRREGLPELPQRFPTNNAMDLGNLRFTAVRQLIQPSVSGGEEGTPG